MFDWLNLKERKELTSHMTGRLGCRFHAGVSMVTNGHVKMTLYDSLISV